MYSPSDARMVSVFRCLTFSLRVVLVLCCASASAFAGENPRLLITPEQIASVEAKLVAIDDFIAQAPDSPEVPVLRMKLGNYFRSTGQFSKAMEQWKEAYALSKDRQDERGRHSADRALANYARQLASLGRLDELLLLFEENKSRQIINPDAANIWQRTSDAAVRMHRNPEVSYKCGVYALANVANKLTGQDFKTIAALGSPETGFSLANLEGFERQCPDLRLYPDQCAD